MSKQLLMIFIKNIELGKAKTRLAKTVGDVKALEVYKALLKKTMEAVKPLENTDKIVYYSNHVDLNDQWSNEVFEKAVQYNGSLGERMIHAFKKGFEEGYEKICIIGSDCWDLETDRLKEAFDAMDVDDFVIGPANDGGYYILGMSYYFERLFAGKEFSTDTVCEEAVNEILNAQKTVKKLEILSDIDTEEDLKNTPLWKDLIA